MLQAILEALAALVLAWSSLTTSAATPTPVATPEPPSETFIATRYGESYDGQATGCGGVYRSSDPSILAAPWPVRDREWRCGQRLRITNPDNGRWLNVVRVDSCPGCGRNHVDLSEAGLAHLCGLEYTPGSPPCDYLDGLRIERLD